MIIDSDCSFETISLYLRRNKVDSWHACFFLFTLIKIELPVGSGVI
jgi:hypothetical protein